MSVARQTSSTRRWRECADPFLALIAVGISAASLWVAVGTEEANRRMVAAASWPAVAVKISEERLEMIEELVRHACL